MSESRRLDNTPSEGLANRGKTITPAITRRTFLRYAGIGIGAAALSNPLPALAAGIEDADNETNATSQTGITGEAPRHIKDIFKFGPNNSSAFTFDENFFSGSSFEYRSDIATFACCLALASYGVNTEFSEYAKSADNIKTFLAQLSCEDVLINDDYTQPTAHDTLGLACAHRSIETNGEDFELVLLGIRGGFYFLEWGGNALLGREGDHAGFRASADKAYAFLQDYVNTNVPTDKPLKILIAGFSRGAAVTNMIGGTMAKDATKGDFTHKDGAGFAFGGTGHDQGATRPFPNHQVWQSDVYLYGFEVPQVVIKAEFDSVGLTFDPFGNIHNIVNPCDVVPKLAPDQWGFTRFGSDFVLPCPSDSSYASARDKMKTCLQRINTTAVYPVDSFNQMGMTMDVFFDVLIDRLIDDLFINRENYCNTWQQTAIDLLDYVQSGKLAAVEQGISMDTLKNFLIKDIVFGVIGKPLNPAASAFEIARLFVDLATDRLFNDMLDLACSILRRSGLAWSDDEEKLYRELSAICPALNKFAEDNIVLIASIFKAFLTDSQTFKIHNGAICLAWMQSFDTETYPLPTSENNEQDKG